MGAPLGGSRDSHRPEECLKSPTENMVTLSHNSWVLDCEDPGLKGGLWVHHLVGPGARTRVVQSPVSD